MQKPINYLHLATVILVSASVGLFCHYRWEATSTWPEFWAFMLGAVAVYFQTVEHVLTWPTWITSVLIYSYVFFNGRLYADSILQIFYFGLSIHGWISWSRGIDNHELPITRMKPIYWLPFFGIIAAGTALYTPVLMHFNGAAPLLDASLSITSVVTQFLLNRKIYENWMIWVVVNGAYIPLYISRHYYATAILYGVFWILAVVGWITWRKSMKASQTVAA